MHQSLRPFIFSYDKALHDLWDACEGLDDQDLNYKPAENEWSIAQIHHHLILSEKFSFLYLEKKLQFPHGLKKVGVRSWWNFIRLKWALEGPFKLNAPKHVAKVPDYSSREDLKNEWEKTRHHMKTLLESIPKKLIHTNLYKHPLTGRFGIIQMLRFFTIHIRGHIKQVEKIKMKMNPS